MICWCSKSFCGWFLLWNVVTIKIHWSWHESTLTVWLKQVQDLFHCNECESLDFRWCVVGRTLFLSAPLDVISGFCDKPCSSSHYCFIIKAKWFLSVKVTPQMPQVQKLMYTAAQCIVTWTKCFCSPRNFVRGRRLCWNLFRRLAH